MEFYLNKPNKKALPLYKLSKYEEQFFSKLVLSKFNEIYPNYFDEYGSFYLYDNHVNTLYELVAHNAVHFSKELLDVFKECIKNKENLYYSGD